MNTTDSSSGERKQARTKWAIVTAGLCLASLLAGRYTARPQASAEPDHRSVPIARRTPAEDIETVEPYGPIITDSQGDYTPELIRRASHILNGYTLRVWDGRRDWLSKKLFMVVVMDGAAGTFMERNGTYIQVDSGAELIATNEILTEYSFTRQDFDHPQRACSFLDEVTALQRDSAGIILGSGFGDKVMGPLEYWLGREEKDEAVLRNLCRDPEFTFDGDVWTAVFNMIKPDGGVDRWRVVGEHDSQANINEIWGIRVVPLKPPGTFSYALLG
jgi:uncharacterized ubiquitin-like protein YukD